MFHAAEDNGTECLTPPLRTPENGFLRTLKPFGRSMQVDSISIEFFMQKWLVRQRKVSPVLLVELGGPLKIVMNTKSIITGEPTHEIVKRVI